MRVTSTEFKTNFGKYLDIVADEDIIITRNGRKIAKLVKEEDDILSDVRSLYGILADSPLSGMSDREIKGIIRDGRGKKHDSDD